MNRLDEVHIDVRDRDYSWFEGLKAYLDREYDRYYFPLESVERLGEPDEESGNYYIAAGNAEAEAEEVDVDGQAIKVWGVGCGELIVRPSRAGG